MPGSLKISPAIYLGVLEQAHLIKKNGRVIPHTDLKGMEALDGISTPDMTITEAEWEAAGGLARIIDGEIFLGKTADEKEREAEIGRLTLEEVRLQVELDAKDYKVIKASELRLVLAEEDLALHERRGWCRSRINEIRERFAELEA
jgi:hypothetical protein